MLTSPVEPTTIVITGASRGLGRALALAYAAPGRRLGLMARDAELLAYVARQCEMQGARIIRETFDVADHARMRSFVQSIEVDGPIDLLIANAGQFWGNGPDGAIEPIERALSQLETNLEGAIVSVDAVLPGMRARRQGQIALIASLAALHPLADAPAYSASKAGLAAYGEALQEMLMPERIRVSIVYPGHIETDQIESHVGPLPMLMMPDEAAAIIQHGLARGAGYIAFPKPLLWLIRLSRFLPWQLRARLGRSLRFHVSDRSGT